MPFSKEKSSTTTQESAPNQGPNPPTQEEIAIAAYEIYISRGATDGNDVDDWLEAERALLSQSKSPTPKSKATTA